MTLRIRHATADDAEALASLATQLGYPSDAPQTAQRLQHLATGCAIVLVAVDEGLALGWIHAGVQASLLLDNTAEIMGLIVDQPHRGQGIGQALLSAAQLWAVQNGCSTLLVRTNIVRQRAHGFYFQNGFQHTKTSLTLTKRLDQ
jgi:GNAT superfamily N-acetyltransferase